MAIKKKKIYNNKIQYKWIYDTLISKLYDISLKIGLTPTGENILRMSVYNALLPYVNKGDKILDLCCGTGTLTILLSKLLYSDCKIIGVDISRGQIAQAQKKLGNNRENLTFKVMDAKSLNFKDENFNIVVISAALHEMDKNERINVLREINRVLKKEGIFLIFEHHEPSKTSLRVLYNFYLGFTEKLLSKSAEMQRNILMELKRTSFKIIGQTPVRKFFNFFQVILCKKES
jgi:ubiquinone/menaquinone biosynthesis C-methylase UbiE